MRRRSVALTAVFVLLAIAVSGFLPHAPSHACSSFAVYSEKILYGMNFDYPRVDIRFVVTEHDAVKVFQMEFDTGMFFTPTVGMNNKGLMSSCQMLFPEGEFKRRFMPGPVYTWELLGNGLRDFETVEEVLEYVEGREVINWGVSLHNLFADPSGDAVVIDPSDVEYTTRRIDGDFIVMTNFPNSHLVDTELADVTGVGSGRYRAAHKHIVENFDEFDVSHALETLHRAVAGGEWATLCSMVFDPTTNEVYIVVDRDFSKVWKLSIDDGTIGTFIGFDKSAKMDIGEDGIEVPELLKLSGVVTHEPNVED